MTRLGPIFWLVLVLVAGFTTFKVKYAVQDLDDELNRVRRQTIAEQQETRVLTAEWTYLNQPERLAELNRRFLGLAPIAAKQLQRSIDNIPLRPPTAPPDSLAAASPDPAPPDPAATPLPVAAAAPSPAPVDPETAREINRANPGEKTPEGDVPTPPEVATPVRLAKAGPTQTTDSLDALIAQIAETR
jgi:cell division protein FtsL